MPTSGPQRRDEIRKCPSCDELFVAEANRTDALCDDCRRDVEYYGESAEDVDERIPHKAWGECLPGNDDE